MKYSVGEAFKKNLKTGLMAFLPVLVTVNLVALFIKLIFNNALVEVVNDALFYAYGFRIPFLGPIIFIAFLLLLGLFANKVVKTKFFSVAEKLIAKMPMVGVIYRCTRQVVHSFRHQSLAFKHACTVEYPAKGIYSVGFITGKSLGSAYHCEEEVLYKVFLPTTPNPTSGMLRLFPEKDVRILEMPVEEALKMLVSAGIVDVGAYHEEKQEIAETVFKGDTICVKNQDT